MRCPHCRGEIPPGSQFCGVCGQNVASPPTGTEERASASREDLSPSLFELPVSAGAKTARVAMILGLNLLLLGSGTALLMEYLDKRERAAHGSEAPEELSTTGRPDDSPRLPAAASGDAGAGANEQARPEPNPEDAGASRRRVRGTSSRAVDAGPQVARSRSSARATPDRDSAKPRARRPAADAGRQRPSAPLPPVRSAPDAGRSAPSLSPAEESRRTRIIASKITQIVGRHQGQLERCYQRASKTTNPDQPLEGRIEIQFTVQPAGSASGVSVSSNTTDSAALGKCLVGLVRSWSFPAGEREALDFVWPFEFQAPR